MVICVTYSSIFVEPSSFTKFVDISSLKLSSYTVPTAQRISLVKYIS